MRNKSGWEQNGNNEDKIKSNKYCFSITYPIYLYPDPGSNRDGSESTGV